MKAAGFSFFIACEALYGIDPSLLLKNSVFFAVRKLSVK